MMKKIFVTIMSLAVLMSCEDLTELNNDPKRSPVAPAGSLFASAQKALVDNLTTPDVNDNIFRLLAQQWTETTYTDESNYDLGTRNIPQNWWHAMYRDVLQDLREAKKIITADAKLDADTKTNQLAMIEIVEVYTWAILVDTFGDIPYEDALKVTNSDSDVLQPKYDDDAAIYPNLITRLNAALGSLNPAAASWGESDLLYAGDVAQWVKFGNSIKLRLGMMLADANSSLAKTTVESAAANVFQSNADNATFLYKSAPPNTNPVWVNLVQSGRKDFVVANTFVDEMTALDDPRSEKFFTAVDTIIFDAYEDGEPAEGAEALDTVTVYWGGKYGANNNYSTYSKPADLIDNSDFPALVMDYAEVQFLLAEAAARGFTVPLTAAQHYESAIRASMEYWGVEDADIAAYLLKPEVAYASAPGTYNQKIGLQKWFALYNRGFEAWTEWRRLDYPILVAPADALSDVPLRYTYPVSEQNLNTINYDNAVSAIGEDEVSTQVFWDVN